MKILLITVLFISSIAVIGLTWGGNDDSIDKCEAMGFSYGVCFQEINGN